MSGGRFVNCTNLSVQRLDIQKANRIFQAQNDKNGQNHGEKGSQTLTTFPRDEKKMTWKCKTMKMWGLPDTNKLGDLKQSDFGTF